MISAVAVARHHCAHRAESAREHHLTRPQRIPQRARLQGEPLQGEQRVAEARLTGAGGVLLAGDLHAHGDGPGHDLVQRATVLAEDVEPAEALSATVSAKVIFQSSTRLSATSSAATA